jgi:GcrA cell cycle regulator
MTGVRNPNTEEWTPAREHQLRELKAKGYSAAQIAKQMGGTTKNAVIGKLDRLGLGKASQPRRQRPGHLMETSPNQGVKTKALATDISPAELLAPRRFSWESSDANG